MLRCPAAGYRGGYMAYKLKEILQPLKRFYRLDENRNMILLLIRHVILFSRKQWR